MLINVLPQFGDVPTRPKQRPRQDEVDLSLDKLNKGIMGHMTTYIHVVSNPKI